MDLGQNTDYAGPRGLCGSYKLMLDVSNTMYNSHRGGWLKLWDWGFSG